ncbi:RNA polymerase sigma factor [Cystobacter fuscus]|uniref:RNA polymerase sigma factor n=1 Tax=Cystobacter fuscus TaxID=43 RepID=UPI0009E03D7E|nr:sigma factor-like helix-turn-helix DNA-binding protein [Cystobacter fuscus]
MTEGEVEAHRLLGVEHAVLHRFEGMGFAEIAEAMGLTESAVKVRAHRGYARLRELLSALEQEAKE